MIEWVLPAMVGLVTLHTVVNARLLRPVPVATVDERVSVLVPARDEASRIGACLESLLAQQGVADLELIVLDDGSTDGTAEVARALGVRVIRGEEPPPGWLGKPAACQRLADHATGTALVYVDADVVLEPRAVAGAVRLLDDVDLVTPYPRIVGAGRLVQPLLQWSWLTFLPLRAMERSRRPSLAAAGGQFLAIRRAAYDAAGGHAAVRGEVVEDVALARAVKRAGGRIALADGSPVATCHMYSSRRELVAGYTKSAWTLPLPVLGLLLLLYVVPLVWWPAGAVAYALGVTGRIVSARATGGRWWPDALAHPLSIVMLVWLSARSRLHRRRGELTWKGRRLA